jgi:hypothetical protein
MYLKSYLLGSSNSAGGKKYYKIDGTQKSVCISKVMI